MDHDAAVSKGPSGAPFDLVANEAVLDPDSIVRIVRLVEEVSKGFLELLIPLISYLEETILHTKSVGVIDAQVVIANLGCPTIKVLSIEQWDPVLRARTFGFRSLFRFLAQRRGDGMTLDRTKQMARADWIFIEVQPLVKTELDPQPSA